VIKLEQNYRSTVRILNVSNNIIENNRHIFDKKLWSNKEYGEQIKVISLINDEDEEQFRASDIFFDRVKSKSIISDYS
ncbi:3'-5' exonuclease, partial [Francisella tularensis]|uniref:3'-5' exonuclease n=1 Tax=Francisella tularensis TaxID=263 RepID=UPI002381B1E8